MKYLLKKYIYGYLLGVYFLIPLNLFSYDGMHRKIHWAQNWCWLDSALHNMVEMDPILHVLQSLKDKNRLDGLNLELFKVLRALQNPKERNEFFNDILRDDNKINIEKLYTKLIEKKLLKRCSFQSFYESYYSLLDNLEESIQDDTELTDELNKVKMLATEKETNDSYNVYDKSSKFFDDLDIAYKPRDYFCTYNSIDEEVEYSTPKIIRNVLTADNKNADYEVFGFYMAIPNYHMVSLTKSKNGKWYWYDDLSNKGPTLEMIEGDIDSILQTGFWKNKNYYKKFYVNVFFYKKMALEPEKTTSESLLENLIKLLSVLKTKLQDLLQQVQVLKRESL